MGLAEEEEHLIVIVLHSRRRKTFASHLYFSMTNGVSKQFDIVVAKRKVDR